MTKFIQNCKACGLAENSLKVLQYCDLSDIKLNFIKIFLWKGTMSLVQTNMEPLPKSENLNVTINHCGIPPSLIPAKLVTRMIFNSIILSIDFHPESKRISPRKIYFISLNNFEDIKRRYAHLAMVSVNLKLIISIPTTAPLTSALRIKVVLSNLSSCYENYHINTIPPYHILLLISNRKKY